MAEKNSSHMSEKMEGFERVCRSKGLRVTHQRLEIFRAMARYPGHPTAENIFKKVRRHMRTISLDTVYRTIATFEEYGLIKRVQIFDNSARFDLNLAEHHHLVCTRCGRIEDFYWPDFDRIELPGEVNRWGEIDSRHVEVRGLCQKCKKATGN